MGTTDVGLIRFLRAEGPTFTPIGFAPDETEAEEKFILDLKEEVLSKGIGVVAANYPPLVAFFNNIQKHERIVPEAVLEIIHHGLQVLKEDIAAANGNFHDVAEEKLQGWKAPLGVLFYLLYKCYNVFSALVLVRPELDEPARPVSAKTAKKSTAQAKTAGGTNYPYWYDWEPKLLDLLSQIINQPFKNILWKNTDADFMGFIVQCCSIIVRRNPSDVSNDEKYFETLVKILKNLWLVHGLRNEVLNMLIMSIDKSDESREIVACIAKEFAVNGEIPFLPLFILERSRKMLSAGKTGMSEKALASFIIDVSDLSPQLVTTSLPVMINILHGNSAVLRAAVVTALGSLMKSAKSEDHQTQTLRKNLLKRILGHVNDININVRVKAITACTKLIDEKCLLLDELIQALNVVSKKINDKASSVRKAAIIFFKTIGSTNPILTKFSLASIQLKLRTHLEKYFESMVEGVDSQEAVLKFVAQKFVEEVTANDYGFDKLELPEEMNTADKALAYMVELLKGKNYWRACEAAYIAMDRYSSVSVEQAQGRKNSAPQYYVLFKSYFPEIQGNNDIEFELGTIGDSARTQHIAGRVNYYKGMKKLKIAFQESFPVFCKILEIGTAVDKKDTINLFAGYCEDGFIPTRELTNSIMTALGKVDVKLASDLVDAFFRIFIPGMVNSSKEIAIRLVNLVASMSTDNKEKMITLFQQMFKNTSSIKNCVNEIWEIYKGNDVERSIAAAYLLGVKGSLDEKLFFEWIEPMMIKGFGRRGSEDFSLATACCNALLIMYEHATSKEPDGLYEHHLIFERCEKFILYGLENMDATRSDQEYADFVDVAIRLIYYVCNDPTVIIADVLQTMSLYVFPENFSKNPLISESKVKRYTALAAVIVECHIYFYEVIVMEEIKQRKVTIEQKKAVRSMGPPPAPKGSKQAKAKGKKSRPSAQDKNTSVESLADSNIVESDIDVSKINVNPMSRRHVSMHESVHDRTNEMEEMIGAGDLEFDRIRNYLDGLLTDGVMSQIRVHVLTLCQVLNTMAYSTQVSCIELLTKVMCINAYGIAGTIPYFVSLWERTNCPYVKVELIKAAIYINMRFPNSMEQCNKLIMTGLRSENIHIRVATLDFVIYLCLSEVIKVREYLVQSSICLNDPHLPIRDAAQDFFVKMGEKTNNVFNSLPEIITFLTGEKDISLPDYQQMMKFLFTKVKKPTQLGGFIEKLMARFRSLEPGRPRQDVAYCLSLLSYNDKTFRIIDDRFTLICDKLDDDEVYNSFIQIVNNAKKNCTKEYRITVEKFEANLIEWKENCDRREGHSRSIVESMIQGKKPSKKSRQENQGDDSDSGGEQSSELSSISGDENERRREKRSRKSQNQNENTPVASPMSEDSEEERSGDENEKRSKNRSRKNQNQNENAVAHSSSEESSSGDKEATSGDENKRGPEEMNRKNENANSAADSGSDEPSEGDNAVVPMSGEENEKISEKRNGNAAADLDSDEPGEGDKKAVAPTLEDSEDEEELPTKKRGGGNKEQVESDESEKKVPPPKKPVNRKGRKPKVVSEDEEEIADIPNVFSDSD